MRPTTKTKRESTRQATRHTQSRLSSIQKVNYYLSNPMGGSNPRPPSKRNNAVHHQGKKNDHIIPLSTQREREKGRPCPTTNTKRQRAGEYGRQATTHTQSRSSPQLNEGQNPVGWLKPHNLKHTKNHHVPRGKRMIISFDY